MTDTWFSRELPILKAAHVFREGHPGTVGIDTDRLEEELGIDRGLVILGMENLENAGVIKVSWSMGGHGVIHWLGPEALKAVGAWPTANNVAEQIIDGLTQAADDESDPEKKGKLRTAVGVLGSGVLGTSENVLAAVIAKAMGLA